MTDASQFNLPHSLSVDLHGDIAVLSLSRPEKRNAIDTEIIHGIDHILSVLPITGIRAVVIRGKGDHFSADADLSSINDTCRMSRRLATICWDRRAQASR